MMSRSLRAQQGATLLVTLIMLVLLTLFAVSGFNLSSINLKIAANYQAQKDVESAAQQAVEQVITSSSAFSLTPSAQTVCVNGSGASCTGGYNVSVSAPKCNYSNTASGYSKVLGQLSPEDTDWEIRATVTDSVTGAQTAIVQGIRIRLLAGNCPTT